jgi:hypothetical protein
MNALHKLDKALARATSHAEWQALAAEHDRASGAEDWRASDDSELLHVPEIRRSIATAWRCCGACVRPARPGH